MFNSRPQAGPWPIIDGIKHWWRNWSGANSRLPELMCCGEDELERMAHDLGMPVSQFRRIAGYGPDAAALLFQRMAALNLGSDDVLTTAPGTLRDLQRVCTLCASHRKCARDLGRNPADSKWEDYCPNVAMLKLLDTLVSAERPSSNSSGQS